ncbi:MAG: LOG family protein [Phycisphaerae bacterium]|nr:LOG family protein [Phycisphaerae bacterium]
MTVSLDKQTDEERRRDRAAAIEDFGNRFLQGPNQDLLQDMLVTIARLARDEADRGDIKLLHKSLAELRYALKVFAPYGQTRKVTIFGSSRTPEDHPDYQQAVLFARKMCESGWMVITGAGDGIMKAGHGGAGREASFGVAIRLPFEQKTNTIIADDSKLVNFRYFFTRKLMFVKEASTIVLFPGGFGTQDEGFEALTLIQTGKASLIPVVMLEQPGGTYWLQWRAYVVAELLRTGMINEQDMSLFRITDDADVAVREVLQFYRVYHSMRYVGEHLVLRLLRPISDATLERLNDEFGEILETGRIEQCSILPEENGECPDYPRLRLHFDRKSCGRLRRLFDVVNEEPEAPV